MLMNVDVVCGRWHLTQQTRQLNVTDRQTPSHTLHLLNPPFDPAPLFVFLVLAVCQKEMRLCHVGVSLFILSLHNFSRFLLDRQEAIKSI